MPLTQAAIPGTDDWYLMQLATEMGANFPRQFKLQRYRTGDAPVPDEASSAMRAAYLRFVNMSRLNMCDLIVNAKTNRQKVNAFRTNSATDDLGDDEAAAAWKRSNMSVGARAFFADAAHYGKSFLTVYANTAVNADGSFVPPYMVPSNGWTTWTRQDADRPWITDYAIQVGFDPVAMVDRIVMYGKGWGRIAERPVQSSTIPTDGSVWKPTIDFTWTSERVPLGWTIDCPVVQYETLDGLGVYEKHLDSIDRINDTIKQRATITAMQAFRQRGLQGDFPQVYPPDHPQAGEKIDYDALFKAGPAALWLLPKDSDIWESSVTDISPIIAAAKDDMKNLAAVTATPLYVLSPDAASGSAEGAASAKETLIFSVEELNDIAEGSLAQAVALVFQGQGDLQRGDPSTISVVWASIDRMTIAERAAASSLAKAGGMPQRFIDEKVFGFTPTEIRQAAQDREDDAFAANAAALAEQEAAAQATATAQANALALAQAQGGSNPSTSTDDAVAA